MFIRTMHYEARIDDFLVTVKRLVDGVRYTLSDPTSAQSFGYCVNEIERLDCASLGNKPSRGYCAAFDAVCKAHFH